MIKQTIVLIGFILLAQSAGILGSLATVSNIDSWYEFLVKPALSPPNWVFGPVWTLLYTLMGIAAFLVWRSKKAGYVRALIFFGAHLIVNTAWTLIFFGEQNIGMGLAVIILLDLWIAALIWRFWRFSKTAAYLLIPYLLWALFATYLNFGYYWLNV